MGSLSEDSLEGAAYSNSMLWEVSIALLSHEDEEYETDGDTEEDVVQGQEHMLPKELSKPLKEE